MLRARLLVLFALSPMIALGYGVPTHRVLSTAAVANSRLSDAATLKEWGIDGSATTPTITFPNTRNGTRQTISLLIAVGAVSEDDFPQGRHHFWDPISNKGLNSCGFPGGEKSLDWAVLGTGQTNPGFSFAQARKSMLQAFISSTKQDRDGSFGRLFESVGHVIHHIQDMAQPQHVRNDQHLDLSDFPPGFIKYPEMPWVDNRSRYEAYTDTIAASIASGGYQNVKMEEPTYYWRNNRETGLAQFTNANFVSQGTNFRLTSNGFVSNATYPRPAPNGDVNLADIEQELFLAGLCPDPGNPKVAGDDARCSLRGTMFFIANNVTDNLTGEPGLVNTRAASYSILNQDLQAKGLTDFFIAKQCSAAFSTRLLFTVNERTFPAAHQFLLPRAIGYSAGMIDYVFRGKIDLVPRLLSDGSPDGTYEFKNLGDEQIDGVVRLYYDDADGVRYPVTGGQWLVTRLPPEGKVSEITIPPPASPAPHKPGVYMMVFTGTMGLETSISDGPGAVVAKVVEVPVPEVYWSVNGVGEFSPPRPVVPAGNFELSFRLPEGLDKLLQRSFSDLHVKVDGRDYVASAPIQLNTCDVPGGHSGDGMGYSVSTEPLAWNALHILDNRVVYENLAYIAPIYGTADQFLNVFETNVNYVPWCSTRLFVEFTNPYENHSIEYFIGSSLLFKFCSRLEPDPSGPLGWPKLVLSRIQGMRVHQKAIGVRVESPPVIACPG